MSLGNKYSLILENGFPEDWELVPIATICINDKGAIKIGPFGSQLKRELLVNKGYKVYGQENIYRQDLEIGSRFISANHFSLLKSCELLPGDFVISMMGTIGQSMIIPDEFVKGIMDSHLIRIRFNKTKVDLSYIKHLFSSVIVSSQMQSLAVGGIMAGLSSSIIKQLIFPLPPLPEQQAIAEVLSDMDSLIQAQEALIEKKKLIKQGAMQELLTGKCRLPGFADRWIKVFIGDILDYEQPGNYLVDEGSILSSGSIPVLTAGKTFILGYTDDTHGVYKNLPVILFDDFLTISRYIDFPFKVKSSAVKFLHSKPNNIDLRFIFEKMQVTKFIIQDHKRHYLSEYQKLSFLIPSFDEQIAISTVIKELNDEINCLSSYLDKLRLIKQGMMQALLTGKIRLV